MRVSRAVRLAGNSIPRLKLIALKVGPCSIWDKIIEAHPHPGPMLSPPGPGIEMRPGGKAPRAS